MMTYEPQATEQQKYDLQMEVDISVYDPANIFVFHDKPFSQELSWIEYDVTSGRLDFIADDGNIKNFGIPVKGDVGKYLQNNHLICVVLRDGVTALSDVQLPLITHH